LRRRKDKIDRRLIQNPAYGPVVFSLFFAKAHLFFGADVLFCIFPHKKAHYLAKSACLFQINRI